MEKVVSEFRVRAQIQFQDEMRARWKNSSSYRKRSNAKGEETALKGFGRGMIYLIRTNQHAEDDGSGYTLAQKEW